MTSTTRCPICHKPSTAEHKPFCSPRCHNVDLAKWFTGSYAVPAVELDDADIEAIESAEDEDTRDV